MKSTRLRQGLTWLFSPPDVDRATAILRTERLSALTHLVSSAEHLARPEFRRPGGLNNWSISRESNVFKNPFTRKVLDAVGAPAATNALHAVRIASSAGLLLTRRGHPRVRLVGNAILTGTSFLLHPRNHYGTDGSDQASFLVQAGVTLARATDRPAVQDAALWAMGLQGVLAYTVSGWAKLAGQTWRKGEALQGVTRTMTYGSEPAWKLFRKYPRTTRALGASVLALECAAPLAMFPGGRLARPYAAATTSMHLGIAGTMALGRFVPSFTALHPSMSYIARPRTATASQGGGVRDGRMPRSAAVLGAAAAVAGAVAFVRNRRTVQAGRGDEQVFTTADGATLSYRRFGNPVAGNPVIFFENALIGTPEHWEWMAQDLGRDHEIVTYHRAGYGTSRPGPDGVAGLDTLAGHAAELVAQVADGRPVVVVGHSLGGYLALLTAALPGSSVDAVVLVDTSHPAELRRSPRQAAGADILTSAFPMIQHSLRLGCAPLLPVADWVTDLPVDARKTALAQYRDHRLWTAGRKEWAQTLVDFETAEPPAVPCPVLVLTAEATATSDPIQLEMHTEMAALGTDPPRLERIPDATHDSIVTKAEAAGRAVAAIRRFQQDRTAAASFAQIGVAG